MDPKHLNIGLQLYSVSEETDLRCIPEIGFTHVESFRDMPADLNLPCHSAHSAMPELLANLDDRIAFAKSLGASYLVCSVPWVRDPSKLNINPAQGIFAPFFAAIEALTLDDWKWNAENLNRIGEATKKAGIQLAYHNHNFEFRSFSGKPAYDFLLENTDPSLVKMEFDCGWAAVAGFDPVAYLTNYPDRFRLMHLRDFEPDFTPSTEIGFTSPELLGPATPAVIGTGILDYPEILEAAREAGIEHYYIERDPFFKRAPMLDLLRADYANLAQLLTSSL